MEIWEWEQQYNKFSKNYFVDGDILSPLNKEEKDLINEYLRFATSKKFEQPVILQEKLNNTDNNWVYDGCIIKNNNIVHIIKNTVTKSEMQFKLNTCGNIIKVKESELNLTKLDKFVEKCLTDIKYKIFIKTTGRTEEYQKRAYSDVWDIMKALQGRLDEAFQELSPLVTKFIKLNFPFTNDIERRIDSIRVHIYIPLKINKSVSETVDNLVKDKNIDSEGLNKLLKSDEKIVYLKYAKLYIKKLLQKEKLSDIERARCNFIITQALRLKELLPKFNCSVGTYIANNASIPVLMKDERLATVKERAEIPYGTKVKYIDVVSKSIKTRILCLLWCLTGLDKYYLKMNDKNDEELGYTLDYYDSTELKVNNTARKLYYSLNWLESADLTDIKEQIKANDTVQYLDNAEDEINTTENIEYMIKCIYNYTGNKKKMGVMVKARKIIEKMPIDRIHERLSSVSLILDAYDIAREVNDLNENMSIIDKAVYVEKNYKALDNKYNFHLKVCKSVARLGRCSDKQLTYVESAFNHLASKDKALMVKADNVSKGNIVTECTEIPDIDLSADSIDINSIYNALGSGGL